jgi:HEAT repeat protein
MRKLLIIGFLCILQVVPVLSDEVQENIDILLKHKVSDDRALAAETLGNLGDSRAIDPLIQALSDYKSNVIEKSAEALGKIGDTRAVNPLLQLLDYHTSLTNEQVGVRGAAIQALGEIALVIG